MHRLGCTVGPHITLHPWLPSNRWLTAHSYWAVTTNQALLQLLFVLSNILSSQRLFRLGMVSIIMLQMRKWQHRQVKGLAQGHIVNQGQRWDWNLGSLAPGFDPLTSACTSSLSVTRSLGSLLSSHIYSFNTALLRTYSVFSMGLLAEHVTVKKLR